MPGTMRVVKSPGYGGNRPQVTPVALLSGHATPLSEYVQPRHRQVLLSSLGKRSFLPQRAVVSAETQDCSKCGE